MLNWNVRATHKSGDNFKYVHESYRRKADAIRYAKELKRSGEYEGILVCADDGREILDETEMNF